MFSKPDENSSIISPYNFGNDIKSHSDLGDLADINSINLINEHELIFTNASTFNFLNNSNFQQSDVRKPIDGICTFENIQQILLHCNNSYLNDILGKMKTEKIDKDQTYTKLMNINAIKVRKQRKNKNKKSENKNIFGQGRKKKIDLTERAHDKFSSDNVIKKIKRILFKNLIFFCNNILKSENIKIKLKNINYQNVNKLAKKNELELFEMTIEQVISKEISPKYTNFDPNYNKETIAQILEERRDNEVLKSIFYMTYRQWLDIFVLKINNINYKNHEYLDGLGQAIFEKIEKNMPKISETLINIYSKDNIEYLPSFLFYLYNYEKLFLIKRNRSENKA